MPDYYVEWSINVNATSPAEAAEIALQMQRDMSSGATCFDVFDEHGDLHKEDPRSCKE